MGAARKGQPAADAPPPIKPPVRLQGTTRAISPDELASIQQALANGMSTGQVALLFSRNVQSIARIRKAMLAASAVVDVE
jgi:hypothetical protein